MAMGRLSEVLHGRSSIQSTPRDPVSEMREPQAQKGERMKEEEDWEWYYYETNPSPLERVAFWCVTPFCRLVLPYHAPVWRERTDEDHRNLREVGYFKAHCPDHWAQIQSLKEEQDDDEA